MTPGSTLIDLWLLDGGVSADVVALRYREADGFLQTVVVRRHGQADLDANPHIARDEFDLLQVVCSQGIKAPQPLFLDESTKIFPTPAVIVEFVDGAADFEPADLSSFIGQAASELVQIHLISVSAQLEHLPHKSFRATPASGELDESMSESLIRDALNAVELPESPNLRTLLHGDYWPGNWLWRDGNLQAIIDWEDAGVGDPLSDLANCRLELLWAIGEVAMDQFTKRYLSEADIDARLLPAWDLWAALRPCGAIHGWGLESEEFDRMRKLHRQFVERAIAALEHDAPRV